MATNKEIQLLCSNVRALRRQRNLSQREMAAIMGIGISSLRKLESGCLPPRLRLDAVFALADAFSLPPDALFR